MDEFYGYLLHAQLSNSSLMGQFIKSNSVDSFMTLLHTTGKCQFDVMLSHT